MTKRDDEDLPSSHKIEVQILLFLRARGRAIPPKDVYAPVARALGLSESQLRLKVSDGKRSKWEIRCQGARDRLVKLGLMNNGPRGIWSLTNAGEKKAAEIKDFPDLRKDFA